MKTSYFAAVTATVIVTGTLVPTRSDAEPSTSPSIPVGVISAKEQLAVSGTNARLSWSILYPQTLGNGTYDVASVNPTGTLTSNQPVYISVQPVGTGVTACDSTPSSTTYAEARLSLNRGAYKQLFYGTQSEVNPAHQLYIKKVGRGDTIDFGGRYVKNGAFSPFYTSYSANHQIVALVNGATPPTTFPLYQSSALASYLRPYLDSTGKVFIGPLSVLIMMELGQTNHRMQCFDYQDLILLVSFSTKHPNNGHGNNFDGVDSSNPGRGSGGPNGAIDPSAGVDDEIR